MRVFCALILSEQTSILLLINFQIIKIHLLILSMVPKVFYLIQNDHQNFTSVNKQNFWKSVQVGNFCGKFFSMQKYAKAILKYFIAMYVCKLPMNFELDFFIS